MPKYTLRSLRPLRIIEASQGVFSRVMAKYKALLEDMVAIQTVPEDCELLARNARTAESLLTEELAGLRPRHTPMCG